MASAQLGIFKVPHIDNEPMVNGFSVSRQSWTHGHFSKAMVRDPQNAKGSKRLWPKWRKSCPSRFLALLMESLWAIHFGLPFPLPDHGTVPVLLPQIKSGNTAKQPIPFDHARHLCCYHEANQKVISDAIDGALAAKEEWETLPWNDRAAIFLKAADLASGKYRYKLMAATMLGQGKNAWQAEIDAAAEVW